MIYNNAQASGTAGQVDNLLQVMLCSSICCVSSGVIIMINTVEKKYLNGEFVSYQVTFMLILIRSLFCTTRHSKHRLPSNSGMDSRRKHCDR
jgi:hypothetical protein